MNQNEKITTISAFLCGVIFCASSSFFWQRWYDAKKAENKPELASITDGSNNIVFGVPEGWSRENTGIDFKWADGRDSNIYVIIEQDDHYNLMIRTVISPYAFKQTKLNLFSFYMAVELGEMEKCHP